MTPSLLNNLIFLLVGWLLGIISQQLQRTMANREQKRKVFTRLHRVLEEMFIDIELQRAAKDAGVLQTFEGMFDIDEAWTNKLPHHPPHLPKDFNNVSDQFSEWEAQRGNYELTKQLLILESLVQQNEAIYAGLTALAKKPELGEIPERPLLIYKTNIEETKKLLSKLLDSTWPTRLNLFRRNLRRIRKLRDKRKSRKGENQA